MGFVAIIGTFHPLAGCSVFVPSIELGELSLTEDAVNLFAEALDRVASALDEITVRDPKKTFRQSEEAYLRLLNFALKGASGFSREIRRRVAERVFLAASDKPVPVREVRKRFNRLARLGFTDNLLEFEMRIIFARYLLHRGEKRSAERLLVQTRKDHRVRLSGSQKGTVVFKDGSEKPTWAVVRDTIDVLLAQCRAD
jgi:hypothetical protein